MWPFKPKFLTTSAGVFPIDHVKEYSLYFCGMNSPSTGDRQYVWAIYHFHNGEYVSGLDEIEPDKRKAANEAALSLRNAVGPEKEIPIWEMLKQESYFPAEPRWLEIADSIRKSELTLSQLEWICPSIIQTARKNTKNHLLGLILAVTKMGITKDSKANAMVMETQTLWSQQVEAQQITCPFLQAALTDILNLHFDQKFFPTVEDASLWTFIETLLKLKPFQFYEKDFLTQTKLKLICEATAKKGGDVDARKFNKSVEDYRMSSLINPLLKRCYRTYDVT